MRISDWSSDVCSSDLPQRPLRGAGRRVAEVELPVCLAAPVRRSFPAQEGRQAASIGRPVAAGAGHLQQRRHHIDRLGEGVDPAAEARALAWIADGERNMIGLLQVAELPERSEEPRVGKEGVSTVRYRGSPYQ